MRFDYRIAKEATFNDWVNDGVNKALRILNSIDKPPTEKIPEQTKNEK